VRDTPVVFDRVWKKFRRGERHDSLRDLVPSIAKRMLRRTRPLELEGAQEFWALKDVSFEVQPGEALGIIGPNGAGKSTTLKLLTKILRPTRGACHVRGRVGALIEVAAGFHPDLTGRENVYLQGSIMGMKQAEIARRFDEIVAFSGVEAFIDTQMKRYSSGMNARLGFAVAAHLDPDVLIIDEVLSVGDSMFQARCLERIRSLRNAGVALVFVSHNLPAIESLCHRVLWLQSGEPMFIGDPRSAIRQYLAREDKGRPPDSTGYRSSEQRVIGFESVQLVDASGGATTHLASGASAALKYSIVAHGRPRDVIVGFGLQTADNHLVFGENSTVEMAPLTLASSERVDGTVAFRSLPLPEGRYHINVSLECPTTREVFDRVDRAVSFDVEVPQEANRIGSVRLRTSWTVEHMTPVTGACEVG
jgi:lipopolysaccharide transport system ATP-binding protein